MKNSYIIVDDDKAFTSLLKKKLEQFQYLEFIASFSDTISAARGITKFNPDILFLDMEIDALNGLDVLEVLEKKPKTIVVSGSSEYLESAFALDVVDYIKKPIPSKDRLAIAIERALVDSN